MTVSSVTTKKVYVCDGATTTFAYPFKIWTDADVSVYLFVIDGATWTKLRLDIDYTVTDAGEASGGNVVLTIEVAGNSVFEAAPSDAFKLILMREPPLTQSLDLIGSGAFLAEEVEKALDRLTYQIQRIDEKIGRSYLRDITQSVEVILDPSALGYQLTAINLNDATLSGNLNFNGFSINNIISMTDADLDTGVYVEFAADEDKVRMYAGGTLVGQFDGDGLTLISGVSVNEFSTDGTLGGNSDDAVPTEKAVKTYVDTTVAAVDVNKVKADTGDGTPAYLDGKVDGATIEISAGDKLQVKDGGIDNDAMADDAIHQAELYTTTGELSVAPGATAVSKTTLPGGAFAFVPQAKHSLTTNERAMYMIGCLDPTYNGGAVTFASSNITTSYVTYVIIGSVGNTMYLQSTYVQSSGNTHWVFLLYNKVEKKVFASYSAPDHPCYGQGAAEEEYSHPFISFKDKELDGSVKIDWNRGEPLPPDWEIILLDNDRLDEIKTKTSRNRGILQIIEEEYVVDELSTPTYKPREIIEIDKWGDMSGEIIKTYKNKTRYGKTKTLKRRMVNGLPPEIKYRSLKLK